MLCQAEVGGAGLPTLGAFLNIIHRYSCFILISSSEKSIIEGTCARSWYQIEQTTVKLSPSSDERHARPSLHRVRPMHGLAA